MSMSKLKNLTVHTTLTTNPYKRGSFKHCIFAECLKRGQFTRAEFEEFVLELKVLNEVESAMPDTTLVKAWWSELVNKAKCLQPVE